MMIILRENVSLSSWEKSVLLDLLKDNNLDINVHSELNTLSGQYEIVINAIEQQEG